MRSECRALVAVDEVVKVERVDLARIESAEALASVIEQLAEFGLVVLADQLSGSAATLTLALDVAYPRARVHREQPTRRPRTAQRDLPVCSGIPAPRRCAPLRTQFHRLVHRLQRIRGSARSAAGTAGNREGKSPARSDGARPGQRRDMECLPCRPRATPVSVALGRLVQREVASRRRRSASDAGDVHRAADDARLVVEELSALIARLERSNGAQPSTTAAPSVPTYCSTDPHGRRVAHRATGRRGVPGDRPDDPELDRSRRASAVRVGRGFQDCACRRRRAARSRQGRRASRWPPSATPGRRRRFGCRATRMRPERSPCGTTTAHAGALRRSED